MTTHNPQWRPVRSRVMRRVLFEISSDCTQVRIKSGGRLEVVTLPDKAPRVTEAETLTERKPGVE
jgi:hypothetical protein